MTLNFIEDLIGFQMVVNTETKQTKIAKRAVSKRWVSR